MWVAVIGFCGLHHAGRLGTCSRSLQHAVAQLLAGNDYIICMKALHLPLDWTKLQRILRAVWLTFTASARYMSCTPRATVLTYLSSLHALHIIPRPTPTMISAVQSELSLSPHWGIDRHVWIRYRLDQTHHNGFKAFAAASQKEGPMSFWDLVTAIFQCAVADEAEIAFV